MERVTKLEKTSPTNQITTQIDWSVQVAQETFEKKSFDPLQYKFNESKADDAGAQTFVPLPYDTFKQVGGDSSWVPNAIARVGSGLTAATLYGVDQGPKIFAGLDHAPPAYDPASIDPLTLDNFKHTRAQAYPVLKFHADDFRKEKKLQLAGKSYLSAADHQLVDDYNNIETARRQTSAWVLDADHPTLRVDYSKLHPRITSDPRFSAVKDFEVAQDQLITEHRAVRAQALITAKAELAANQKAAALDFGKNIAVLAGSEAVNLAVDELIPRNRISSVSTAVDFIAPIAAASLTFTPWRKFEPIIQAGFMIGSHVATRLLLDEQVDTSK